MPDSMPGFVVMAMTKGGWFLWCAVLGLAVTWSPLVIPQEQPVETRIILAAMVAGAWGGLTGGVLRAWALYTAKVEMAEAIQNYDRLAAQQNEFRDATERALAPHGLWLARWGTDKAGTVNVEFRKEGGDEPKATG